MNDSQNEHQNMAGTLYEYISSFDREIYENEERREDSLIQQATNMQTAFSFVSAAVFMVAQIAIDDNRRASLSLVFSRFFQSYPLSCLFVYFAQLWRKGELSVTSFPLAKDFQELVENNYNDFETKSQREKYIAETYAKLHQSLANSNAMRVKWIQRSMRAFYAALGSCVGGFIIAITILF